MRITGNRYRQLRTSHIRFWGNKFLCCKGKVMLRLLKDSEKPCVDLKTKEKRKNKNVNDKRTITKSIRKTIHLKNKNVIRYLNDVKC